MTLQQLIEGERHFPDTGEVEGYARDQEALDEFYRRRGSTWTRTSSCWCLVGVDPSGEGVESYLVLELPSPGALLPSPPSP